MILKRKLKFGLLLAWVSLLFVACEYDEKTMDYHVQDHAEKHFKVSKVHFKQLQNNKKLMDRLGKLKNTTQQTAARIIQSNDNSFYIDTDVAYLIESENGKHSYTFQIIRQNPQYRLENLILKKNNADGYNLYIAKYDITELEYQQLQNGENPSLINKLKIVPVSNNIINTTNILNRGSAEGMCLTETIIPATSCSCEGHTITDLQNGESCTCSDSETIFPEQTIYSWEPCGNEGGGGGGDPIDDGSYDGPDGGYPGGSGGGTPPNGDSGNGNPNNPPDNTDPNPDNSFEDTQDPVNTTPVVPIDITEPCETIAELVGTDIDPTNDFSTKLGQLKNKVNSAEKNEWSFSVERVRNFDAVANETTTDYNTTDLQEGEATSSTVWQGANYIGSVHTHPANGDKIFSWNDIKLLTTTHELANRGNKRHVVIMMVCENPNNSSQPLVFAIKVNDIEKLRTKIDEDWNDPSLVSNFPDEDERLDQIHKKLGDEYEKNAQNLEKYFLQKFNNYGIDLYQAQNGDLNNWAKLNLDYNTNGQLAAMQQPCNN